MVELIHVGMTRADGSAVEVGDLAFDLESGAHAFRYAPDFLKDGIALCPGYLELEGGEHTSRESFNVFRGALPDNWGMNLLARVLPRAMQQLPYFFAAIHRHALGALYFHGDLVEQVAERVPALNLSGTVLAPVSLEEMAEAVMLADGAGELDHAMLQKLLAYGTSPGGARPKCLVDAHGKKWLAKFPSHRDDYDVVALEHACLTLAGKAGMAVPNVRYEHCLGKRVLLVERFDVTPAGGRVHMLSMASLLGIVQGWYQRSYKDLAQIVRDRSSHPENDVPLFFRQMVFNAAIGNTDDHLHNFMMVNDGRGYRISKAYDLVPNLGGNQEHTLFFEYDGYTPKREALLRIGEKHFGISTRAGGAIIDEVLSACAGVDDTMLASGVPDEDRRKFARDIIRRIEQIG